ncbi:CPBP family glutamic-type intramembrane protease [Actinomadura madurae]|nr:CPBP family glutamic-type intramembrane protease [Actinomadura madurae]MCQ0018027.1 CPBP family glutamic-type intramembrane protease [Actinomadura madurae]
MYRGVLFRILEERTGTWVALTLSALVFGLSHLFNEHATLWGPSPSRSRRAACSAPPTSPPATCGCRSACTSAGTSRRAASSAPRSPATPRRRGCCTG